MEGNKEPVVIELTTNFHTGLTSVVGASSIPCSKCKSQKTKFDGKEIVCQEQGCQTKTPIS